MATLKDVAAESGLAVSTVSRILNNRGYISEQARQSVEDAMKKLNYRPNEIARSMHGKNSNMIGLIVPHIQHPYFAEVIDYIEDYARQRGYRILLYNSNGMPDREKEYIEMCASYHVAGIIICTGGVSLKEFQNLSIPIVGFERNVDYGTATVSCDNILGGQLAAKHLIDKGCRHLMHIGDIIGDVNMPADDRRIGFLQTCEDHKIECRNIWLERCCYNQIFYQDVIMDALKKYPDTDGIFTNSDAIAAQVIQVCRGLKIEVPERLKVIGFDDVLLASLTTPPITTIHQPIEEMAESTVRIIDAAIAEKVVPIRTVLPVELVEREST